MGIGQIGYDTDKEREINQWQVVKIKKQQEEN